jgi:putative FmdB family regulatory protein
MPVYEYECGRCRHRFEVRQGFNDKAQAECPQCQGKARRIFLPTPIIFRGSGFYVTDSRKNTVTEKSKGAEKGKTTEKTAGKETSRGTDKSAGTEKSKGESETGKSSK